VVLSRYSTRTLLLTHETLKHELSTLNLQPLALPVVQASVSQLV